MEEWIARIYGMKAFDKLPKEEQASVLSGRRNERIYILRKLIKLTKELIKKSDSAKVG